MLTGAVGEELLLHFLVVRGTVTAEGMATMAALTADVADELLAGLAAAGFAARTSSGRLRVTAEGQSAHASLLAGPLAPVDRDATLRWYAGFRVLNQEFKDLCTRWQIRDRAPVVLNDHSDASYDQAVIAALRLLHDRALYELDQASEMIPWLPIYAARFGNAIAAIQAGDTARFTAPLTDSYHDVWMQLHDDLLLTLGLTREADDA